MTTEIVIANKEAVALAADSAVTASVSGGVKIFTTADKIFKLAENQSVGIMVYNNSQFMGVPWETIINEVKHQLPQAGFETLDEYVDYFIHFFDSGNPFFPESTIMEYLDLYVYVYSLTVLREIENMIDYELKKRPSLSERSIKLIVSKVIRKELEEWEAIDNDRKSSVSMENSKKMVRYYRKVIDDSLKSVFQDIPISRKAKRNLLEMSQHLISKGTNDDLNSGVVIAGFGEREAFPVIRSFLFEGIFKDKLKYFELSTSKVGVTTEGSVIAFAQREMVARFMEGVDPVYKEIEKDFMLQIGEKFAKVVTQRLKRYNASERKKLSKEIKEHCHKIVEDYQKTMEEKIKEQFTTPVTEVVAVLPKSDLATLAESLVSLTSVKRKFSSSERETVAEPIDVAIISKTDGFVWIKKKLYYKKELS